MINHSLRTCVDCQTTYLPTGPSQKRCPTCSRVDHLSRSRERTMRYRTRLGRKTGVGKGGNNAKGTEDSQHVSGMSYFMKIRKVIKEEVRYCQRCSKDLIDATRHYWCVHHIDHDRTNNVRSNLMLLCKRCHQIEHECHKAFKCVTTRDKSRSGLD